MESGGFHVRKRRDKMLPLRLDEQIFEAGADQIEIASRAAGNERRHAAAMLDRELQRHLFGEDRAGHPRFHRSVRVQQDRDHPLRRGQTLDERRVFARGKHQSAEQTRHDIVPVRRIGRDALALEREGQQLLERERFAQERVRGHCGSDGRGRGSTHAGGERHPFGDRQADPAWRARRGKDSLRGGQRGVLCRRYRQRVDQPADPHQPHAGLVVANCSDDVARRIERLPEDVEADADIADARRGAGGGGLSQHWS